MIRREPSAFLTALKMDPARRHLFVEGHRDRLFLNWLAGDKKKPEVVVLDINAIEIKVEQGGNRQRLFEFARRIPADVTAIRFFADADFDRILARPTPTCVWLTDCRDFEGYVLSIKCIDKILKIGIATETKQASSLLFEIKVACRKIAELRYISEMEGLSLPFQKLDIARYTKVDGERIIFDFDRYLRAILQNAELSLTELEPLRSKLESAAERLAGLADEDLVHGKDVVGILAKALAPHGVSKDESKRLIWTSFDPQSVKPGSSLDEVLNFLIA